MSTPNIKKTQKSCVNISLNLVSMSLNVNNLTYLIKIQCTCLFLTKQLTPYTLGTDRF
jgi:hypothetical protein